MSPSVSTSPRSTSTSAAQDLTVRPRHGRGRFALTATAIATLSLAGGGLVAPTTASAAGGCRLGPQLEPTCGLLWGAAPAAFSKKPREQTLRAYENDQGRPIDVYHGYHRNNQAWPTKAEKAITQDRSDPRLLLVNWKPATDLTWGQVAAGRADTRIDRAARRIAAFPDRLFVSIWHEPGHFVRPKAGSGMTATDYRKMVRHVIQRLKGHGATNAVFVQIYQGYPKYASQSWWSSLYPGNDVIDWIAVDSYNSGKSSGYNSGGFDSMLNRTKGSWKGWYRWASREHPNKPLMLAEWGVWHNNREPGRQAWFFNDVRKNLSKFPQLKAMLYFNTVGQAKGSTAIDSTAATRRAYRQLSASIPRVDLTRR